MFGFDATSVGLVLSILGVVLGVVASGHVLLNKRRPESAFGWVGVCLLFPVVGPAIYYVFGINRVRTRATKLRAGVVPVEHRLASVPNAERGVARPGTLIEGVAPVGGNSVQALRDGEEAFPAMLEAIKGAGERVLLSTYIFESNSAGMHFVDALADATARGVEVRVLIDGVGELYTRPRIRRILRKRGIRYARFLPPRLWPPTFRLNLRNHRKMLIIDNHTAFVGGMNIGDRHLVDLEPNPKRVADLHFVARGPIVAQVEQLFIRDWEFASGEHLERMGEVKEPAGECACRCISDGPDEDIDRLVGVLLASIGAARERVWVMTPYFLPPRELIGALQAAALQGLDVAVILPEENNLPYVHRATRHMLWEPIRRGVQVYYQPPPFVHSKVLIVDDAYAQVGSANWDARSLRLNFELALEVFGCAAVEDLAVRFAQARAASKQVALSDLEARRLPKRLIDGAAWLMSPYL